MTMQRTLRLMLFFLATFASTGAWSAAAGQGSGNPPPASKNETGKESTGNQAWRANYVDATCHKLVAIPVSFLIPGGYVTRSPGHGTEAGCLWGTPADLDRVTAEAGSFDFTGIAQGVFWARATGNVGYLNGQFVSGHNKTESAERKELERSGAKIIRYGHVNGAPQPAQEIVAEYQGKRVYMVYLAMGIDSNTLLINYHPPAVQPSTASDQHWQEFLGGISAATVAPAAVAAPNDSPSQPAALAGAATGAFWETPNVRAIFSAYRQKFSGQTKIFELDILEDKVRLFVQDPRVPETATPTATARWSDRNPSTGIMRNGSVHSTGAASRRWLRR
jgi:hypothetical protein